MSHGRARSQLHYDMEHNLHCLLRGSKEWVFLDTRALAPKLRDYWTRGEKFDDVSGGFDSFGKDSLVHTDPDYSLTLQLTP